jgi:hypothetical protein
MNDRPHYPWKEGDALFAAELNAAIMNMATGAMVGETPNATVVEPLWWDSVSGQLFIRYDDGSSVQWVSANSIDASTLEGSFLPLTGGNLTGPVTLVSHTSTPGSVYGIDIAAYNDGAAPATGNKISYLSRAGNSSFDVGLTSFATFDMTAVVGAVPYKLGNWFVSVSPNDQTHYFSAVVAEWNIVNRGPDTGWMYDLAGASGHTGGLMMVPESISFGASGGGEGKNATFAYAVSSSGAANSTGEKVRWYNGLLISPNAIVGQTGRGIYMAGDVTGTAARYPFGPMGMTGTWLHGIDHTAATYADNHAETFKTGQGLAWVYGTAASPSITASITGSSNGVDASLTLMTVADGSVILGDGTGDRTLTFNGAASSSSGLKWLDNGVMRWAFIKQASGNLGLFSYNSSGAFIGQALSVSPSARLTIQGGINLGDQGAASVTDLSKGIDFYQGLVGLNLTAARLNYVVPSGNAHMFVVNALDRLAITATGFGFNGTAAINKPTGYGAPTGTATRATFATGSVTLPVLAEHVKALIDDLTSYGLIGA